MLPGMDMVDLSLILAFDGSASVTFQSFGLIATGTARALRDPAVRQGLLRGEHGACQMSLLLWSAANAQEVLLDWTRIDSEAALEAFAQLVEDVPRIVPASTTAIGAALLVCEQLLKSAPLAATRQIIDIAGDGRSNEGPEPGPIRDRLVDDGVTINGLCVLHEEPDLVESYAHDVIGGIASFALQCQDYDGFEMAMRQKLRQEIAGQISNVRFG
jgi:Ca-activated chloride channel family protein